MCLISETNISSKTSYTIECYKVLEVTKHELLSPYFGFLFEIGKIYYTLNEGSSDLASYNNRYFVESGFFHSCKTINKAKKVISDLQCIRRRRNLSPAIYRIFKAEIPANTKFFEGQDEDIASKTLKIIEECVD